MPLVAIAGFDDTRIFADSAPVSMILGGSGWRAMISEGSGVAVDVLVSRR